MTSKLADRTRAVEPILNGRRRSLGGARVSDTRANRYIGARRTTP